MDILCETDEGKRMRLDITDDFAGYLDHDSGDLHDSGSDCVAMESPEEEPYIDVVSEDSAIHEEFLDDYTGEEVSYSQLSPMDNLMSSHDDSAIIKSEIFDPAYEEMHQMLVSSGGDYEHDFLNNMDTSNLLTQTHRSYSDSALNQSLTEKCPESLTTNLLNDAGSSKSETDVQYVNSSIVTSTESSCINALTNTVTNMNNINSPVLTTPVYFAQGTLGPAGQPNITTHMARLVPSLDGRHYILHVGLDPAPNTTSTMQASATSAVSPPISGTVSVSSVNPASLNITITPATQTISNTDLPTPVLADLNTSSSSPLGGTTLETDQEGNTFLKNNATFNNAKCRSDEILNSNEPVGTNVDVNFLGQLAQELASPLSESILAGPSLTTDMNMQLSDSTREQLLKQMQLLQQPAPQQKSKSSKRRNSRELRELVELEKISSSKTGGELDRFVICSDGPMNCALCGYNTGSYSSFKSHIICSHPCWRITKKLSRNRLLVEKSVKVSIPVANFSVPNPVPAVPIQQRVQSKKNKKETSVSNSKDSKEHKQSKHKEKKGKTSSVEEDDYDEKQSSDMNGDELSPLYKESLTGRERQLVERNKRLFRCTRCLRLFVFEGSVVSHIMDQHGLKKAYEYVEVSNDYGTTFGSMFRCPHGNCCFTTGSAETLDKHKNEKHIMQVVYRCQICGFFADSTKTVKEHAAKIHPEQDMMYGFTD